MDLFDIEVLLSLLWLCDKSPMILNETYNLMQIISSAWALPVFPSPDIITFVQVYSWLYDCGLLFSWILSVLIAWFALWFPLCAQRPCVWMLLFADFFIRIWYGWPSILFTIKCHACPQCCCTIVCTCKLLSRSLYHIINSWWCAHLYLPNQYSRSKPHFLGLVTLHDDDTLAIMILLHKPFF